MRNELPNAHNDNNNTAVRELEVISTCKWNCLLGSAWLIYTLV